MTANKPIDFKDPSDIKIWLDTALKKEEEKYKKCSVRSDMVHDCVTAQGWGYVVVSYFLVEQAFKALLHVRGKPVLWRCLLMPASESGETDRNWRSEGARGGKERGREGGKKGSKALIYIHVHLYTYKIIYTIHTNDCTSVIM